MMLPQVLLTDCFPLGLVTRVICGRFGRSLWSSSHCDSWKVNVCKSPWQLLTQLIGEGQVIGLPFCSQSPTCPADYPQQQDCRLGVREGPTTVPVTDKRDSSCPSVKYLSFLSLSLTLNFQLSAIGRRKSQAKTLTSSHICGKSNHCNKSLLYINADSSAFLSEL